MVMHHVPRHPAFAVTAHCRQGIAQHSAKRGLGQITLHDKPVSVLHQGMPHEAQHRTRAGDFLYSHAIGAHHLDLISYFRQYLAVMNHLFDIKIPFWRFARNTLIVSCLSLLPLLLLYILLLPGFAEMLLGNRMALSRFLRQVVTNGLPVVFVVNYLSFFLYALMNDAQRSINSPELILLIDLPVRIIVFVALHGLIYVLSADWFGSFGGDRWQALRVVGPTLMRSAFFENVSGVYLYATMVSALLLYTTAIQHVLDERSGRTTLLRGFIYAFSDKVGQAVGSVVIALILLTGYALLLTGFAALLVWLQSL